MYDFLDKEKWALPLRVCELYGGIGSQLKALTNIGVDIKEHYLVEVDIDATISYAAIHYNLNKHLNNQAPSKEEMIAYLKPFNFRSNDKIANLSRLKNDKLKKLYFSKKLTNNLGDVTKLNDLPSVDLITWSTPCQDFSNAGLKKGFEGDKGGLTFLTLKLFRNLSYKPTFLLFENVPMIISKKFRDGFDQMLKELDELGYENIVMKLNAKDYGIPQNRNRVFVLSIRKDYKIDYSIPNKVPLALKLKDMLEDEVDKKYYLNDKLMEYMTNMDDRNGFVRGEKFKPHDQSSEYAFSVTTKAGSRPTDNFITLPEKTKRGYKEAYEGDGVYINRPHQKRGVVQKEIIQTLNTAPQNEVGVVVPRCINSKVDGKQPKVQDRIYDEEAISTAVTTSFMPSVLQRKETKADDVTIIDDTQGFDGVRLYENYSPALRSQRQGLKVKNNLLIRKLTPRETWRLMGFDDSDFDKASAIHSNSTLYKQAGNSIVVQVLEAIFNNIFIGENK
jgi:DNA (cytosine-5)-methyltransferase 1